MSETLSPELVDKMMIKCGRRCCICHRFRPTKLQVHHIQERNRGGGNEEDNLIVVCLSCHSDVHTTVPFVRRFSEEELKGHRDALIRRVEDGKWPTTDKDDADEVMRAIQTVLQDAREKAKPQTGLLPEAVEMLLLAVNGNGLRQGFVWVQAHAGSLILTVGDRYYTIGHDDRRMQATYRRAIEQLVGCGLLEQRSDSLPSTNIYSEKVFDVTYEGYLAADEIVVGHGETRGAVGPTPA